MRKIQNQIPGEEIFPELMKRSVRTAVRTALQWGIPVTVRKGNQLVEILPHSKGRRRVIKKLEPKVKVERGARLVLP